MRNDRSACRPAAAGPTLVLAAAVAVTLLSAAGCASAGERRPFVIASATKLRDLYWRGELTDTKGNRWNVKLLQGVAPPLEDAGEAFSDAADFAADPFEAGFWPDRGREVERCVRFAFEDAIDEFVFEGIGEDLDRTGARVSELAREAPFGWIPRIAGRAVWGYVLAPIGRVVGGTIGMAGGLTLAAVVPVGQVVGRPVGGAVWATAGGVALPAVRIAAHQPMYLLATANREPAERHDGSFGLRIVERAEPDGATVTAASPVDLEVQRRTEALDDEDRRDAIATEERIRQLRSDLGSRAANRAKERAGLTAAGRMP